LQARAESHEQDAAAPAMVVPDSPLDFNKRAGILVWAKGSPDHLAIRAQVRQKIKAEPNVVLDAKHRLPSQDRILSEERKGDIRQAQAAYETLKALFRCAAFKKPLQTGDVKL